MQIDRIKVNNYGKLKNKEIELKPNINIIYGKNESGKSTLLNFIVSTFYGISKNKRGKEISDFDRYMPWSGEEFSGKLEYELDNNSKYEVYREFKKKNPNIFNEEKIDISKQFNIDKNKGNEFFYEQTKIDEELFLSTIVVNQQEVKLGKQEQNILIQKLANLVQTGDDNVSYKRAIDRINRRQLEEIGTQRTREKPLNIISKNIERLHKEKEELESYEDLKYEIDESKNKLQNEISNLEIENNHLKEMKLLQENEKIENEKIKIKQDIKNKNLEKINLIKKEINKIEEKNLEKNINENKIEKNKLNKKLFLIFFILFFINIFIILLFKNNLIKYLFILLIPVYTIFFIFLKNKLNKKINNKNNKKIEKINSEKNNLKNQINLIEKNNLELEKEINELKNNFNLKINLEKQKINNKYNNEIEDENLESINFQIQKIENEINNKKIELHTLNLDKQNIEPKLNNLSKIEEELVNNKEKMLTLKKLEESMNIAKEVLANSYENMKETITPKFTQNLSQNISNITDGKYTNILFNDENGLIVELENGNYVSANQLSIGTIDQLYLSLRFSMIEELSDEKMPIILDESFAYYDSERLENILNYIYKVFYNHQIIIFTCTNREKELLETLKIPYNYVKF